MFAEWAAEWGVTEDAMRDLYRRLGALDLPTGLAAGQGLSEAAVQANCRIVASRYGWRLWRNNVGAVHDHEQGIHVRYGLANDSPQVNAVCKSGDLIGIKPRIVTPEMVGTRIGQFISIECKHEAWRWTGDEREKAQAAWAAHVTALGGEAKFVTSATQL
jgi:hypothetical protein